MQEMYDGQSRASSVCKEEEGKSISCGLRELLPFLIKQELRFKRAELICSIIIQCHRRTSGVRVTKLKVARLKVMMRRVLHLRNTLR